ncbi:MAG TPA: AMP-binding protein, partial [Stellaceae bacterium]|nr:AMP-binding protein [Stellaceae bacterium]
MDLCCWLERHADFSPDRIALEFEGRSFSWSALRRDTMRLATVLTELGVGPGERVAHLGYNSPAFLSLLFACARLGALLVPLNWRL